MWYESGQSGDRRAMLGGRGVLVDALVPVLVWVEHPFRGPEAELFCPCKSPAKGLESGWKSGVCLWWGHAKRSREAIGASLGLLVNIVLPNTVCHSSENKSRCEATLRRMQARLKPELPKHWDGPLT